MSRTVDLVKAFTRKRPPIEVETFQQAPYELLDSSDLESGLRKLADVTVSANYCWRVDAAGRSYWINQDQGEKLWSAMEVDEDPGPVIGTLTKVSRDGQKLHWGPVDLHEAKWAKIQRSVFVRES